MRARICKQTKTILIYGLTEEQQTALNAIADESGIICRPILNSQTHLTIGQLLYDKNLPEKDNPKIDGKFALLDGFQNQEQEGVALINRVDKSVIKAVHTPHNNDWKFQDLCKEWVAEHKTMHKENS